ncbi:hypothetical protein H072_663 [Dactylellina haptotyla CBS 200.50]|uniref:Uncharacterized protein n=1 Tax=Dactylellina haptotyla (strain CBS 200.50) TaxID=1284197 RepID=S8C145_DACHA|nr:hypothetical protein H072_663 [Dactylellina haptotyla CBS 200.50]
MVCEYALFTFPGCGCPALVPMQFCPHHLDPNNPMYAPDPETLKNPARITMLFKGPVEPLNRDDYLDMVRLYNDPLLNKRTYKREEKLRLRRFRDNKMIEELQLTEKKFSDGTTLPTLGFHTKICRYHVIYPKCVDIRVINVSEPFFPFLEENCFSHSDYIKKDNSAVGWGIYPEKVPEYFKEPFQVRYDRALEEAEKSRDQEERARKNDEAANRYLYGNEDGDEDEEESEDSQNSGGSQYINSEQSDSDDEEEPPKATDDATKGKAQGKAKRPQNPNPENKEEQAQMPNPENQGKQTKKPQQPKLENKKQQATTNQPQKLNPKKDTEAKNKKKKPPKKKTTKNTDSAYRYSEGEEEDSDEYEQPRKHKAKADNKGKQKETATEHERPAATTTPKNKNKTKKPQPLSKEFVSTEDDISNSNLELEYSSSIEEIAESDYTPSASPRSQEQESTPKNPKNQKVTESQQRQTPKNSRIQEMSMQSEEGTEQSGITDEGTQTGEESVTNEEDDSYTGEQIQENGRKNQTGNEWPQKTNKNQEVRENKTESSKDYESEDDFEENNNYSDGNASVDQQRQLAKKKKVLKHTLRHFQPPSDKPTLETHKKHRLERKKFNELGNTPERTTEELFEAMEITHYREYKYNTIEWITLLSDAIRDGNSLNEGDVLYKLTDGTWETLPNVVDVTDVPTKTNPLPTPHDWYLKRGLRAATKAQGRFMFQYKDISESDFVATLAADRERDEIRSLIGVRRPRPQTTIRKPISDFK